MKTKTLITYGAIAIGAYLAYSYFFKKPIVSVTPVSTNTNAGGLLSPDQAEIDRIKNEKTKLKLKK